MKNYLKYAISTILILSSYSAIASDVDISSVEEKQKVDDARKTIKKGTKVRKLDGTPSERVLPDGSMSYVEDKMFDYNRYVAAKDIVYKTANYHNLINQLHKEKDVLANYRNIIEDYEALLMRFKNNRVCNVNYLKDYYQNPDVAWQNVTEKAYNAEKLISASVAKASSEGKAGSPALARWNVGYKFLKSMYENQSAYGEIKNPFPLWADQKLAYDSKWNTKYAELATALKKSGGDERAVAALAQGPVVGAAKYDRNNYNKVVSAHNDLIRNSFKGSVPNGVDTSPVTAPPAPLPPWKEVIFAADWKDGDAYGYVSLYPEIPTPWITYVDSNFNKFNSKGEMANIVTVKDIGSSIATIEMNKSVLPLDKNRLERYLILRAAEEERRQVAAQVKLSFDAKQAELKKLVENFGVVLDKDVDFSRDEDVNAVIALIKEQKNTNMKLGKDSIEVIEKLYSTDPTREGMSASFSEKLKNVKDMIVALEKDSDGLINISSSNANRSDAELAEAVANKELIDKYKEISNKNKTELLSLQSSWCPSDLGL